MMENLENEIKSVEAALAACEANGSEASDEQLLNSLQKENEHWKNLSNLLERKNLFTKWFNVCYNPTDIVKDHVYLMGDDNSDENGDVNGAHSTASAIGPKLVLSCVHSLTRDWSPCSDLVDDQKSEAEMRIGLSQESHNKKYWLRKQLNVKDGVIDNSVEIIPVELWKFNYEEDWALFIRTDDKTFDVFADIDHRLELCASADRSLVFKDIVLIQYTVKWLKLFGRSRGSTGAFLSDESLIIQSQFKHTIRYNCDRVSCFGACGGPVHIRGCQKIFAWHCQVAVDRLGQGSASIICTFPELCKYIEEHNSMNITTNSNDCNKLKPQKIHNQDKLLKMEVIHQEILSVKKAIASTTAKLHSENEIDNKIVILKQQNALFRALTLLMTKWNATYLSYITDYPQVPTYYSAKDMYIMGDDDVDLDGNINGPHSTATAIGPTLVFASFYSLTPIHRTSDTPLDKKQKNDNRTEEQVAKEEYVKQYWLCREIRDGVSSERIPIELYKYDSDSGGGWALFIRSDGKQFEDYAEIDYQLGSLDTPNKENEKLIQYRETPFYHCPLELYTNAINLRESAILRVNVRMVRIQSMHNATIAYTELICKGVHGAVIRANGSHRILAFESNVDIEYGGCGLATIFSRCPELIENIEEINKREVKEDK